MPSSPSGCTQTSAALAKSKAHDAPVNPAPTVSQQAPSKPAAVSWVFKGTWHIDGTVTVNHGNSRVRKGGYIDQIAA